MLKNIATTTALLVPAAATQAEDNQILFHGQTQSRRDAINKIKESSMTDLIYRGVKHDGQRTTISRKPQKLIYRGVAHDGLPAVATSIPNRQPDLCYRGIRYTREANGGMLYVDGTFPV